MWVACSAVLSAPALEADLGSAAATLHGFFDARAGARAGSDPYQDDMSLAETRLQLDTAVRGDMFTLSLRADLLYDDVVGHDDIDLETGSGVLDLREANVLFYPARFMDGKIGRQILTWGTGDLLFINDLFPKDWQSFLSGRDEEYLKAPSDAVFLSLFPSCCNIDVAYSPRFDPDRYISGERLSYWNPMLGRRAGRDAVADPALPDAWWHDDEVAVRVYRNVRGYELAGYAYDGYWKSPQGFDPVRMQPAFPRLSVCGASARGTLAGGILSVEGGYYDSRDDAGGDAPATPNSEVRALVGYEHEIVRNLTGSVQYYLEFMRDYDSYLAGVEDPARARDEDRHVVTVRLTQQLLAQTLTLSFFAYYSPSDEDAYLRPVVKYKATDAILLTAGANVFAGDAPHTFFGQFEKNSNVYAGARLSF
jgi:hypothetical protein